MPIYLSLIPALADPARDARLFAVIFIVVIAAGLRPDDRVVVTGLTRAIPGEKVVARPAPMPQS